MARNISDASLPSGWKYGLLDSFATRCSGHTPSKSFPEYWNGGIKWVSLADSHRLDKGYVYETNKEISAEGLKHSSAALHPAETVVLSRDAGIGKSGVIAEPMAVSQHFIAWICDGEKELHSWFLYNWLQLSKKEFERQAVGSTIKTIGLPYFKRLNIALPPISEQKKIAQILCTWDRAITATERLLENSQKRKKGLMQQLLTGKKRLPGYYGEWETDQLERLFNFKRGKELSKSSIIASGINKCVLYGELYTRYGEVIREPVSRTNNTDGFPSKAGDVLLPSSTTTSGIDLANATAVIDENIQLGGDIIVLRPKRTLDPVFIAHLLTHIKKHDIASLAQGITIIHLYGSDLKNLSITIPESENEQFSISSVLTTADKEIKALKVRLNCLKQEKTALMQQLLTGKRRVQVEAA